MSVMTAGQQKRRAGAARGRRLVTAVPGQPNVMAGPWPGAGERHGQAAPGERHGGRTVHGTPSRPAQTGAAGTAEAPAAGARMSAAPTSAAMAAVPPSAAVAAAPGSAARVPVARPVRTRLTRRGRIVIAGLAVIGMVLVAALAWLAGTARADAAGSGAPSSAVYHSLRPVIVMPGQSLWSIATQYEPGSDPRSVIQEIVDINALNGTSVQPGQRLWLPRG